MLVDIFVRHFGADTLIGRTELVLELFTKIVPKHRIMAGIGIHGLVTGGQFRVRRIFVQIPGIFQTPVVTDTEDRIAVVKDRIAKDLLGLRFIPKAEHHVFDTLVHASHDLRKHEVIAQIRDVEIICQFGFELGTVIRCGLHPLD